VRAYADSSFILRLVIGEADSPQVIAEYRRLGSPKLFYLSLHALEVGNAILQRAFHERRSLPSGERGHITRERDAALGRLEHLITRGTLIDMTLDMDAATARAVKLSKAHTERLGARAIDLLHVASALTLKAALFLTTDSRQAQLARAEGLKVVSIASEPRSD
jgi:predicted nucleic acid-binding protein